MHPFGALGRELIARGHRITVIQMADLEARVRAEGIGFVPIGKTDHPPGSLAESLAGLAKLKGLAALRYTIDAVRKTTEMMLRDAPAVIRSEGIDALLVDQTEPAGGALADHLRIPFVTVCNALLLHEEADVPPAFTDWSYEANPLLRLRNRLGYALSARVTSPVTRAVNRYRRRWALPLLRRTGDSDSRLLQISQQPLEFDFPRRQLPACFHYVGPLRRPGGWSGPAFPWERLDGRPLVYASLGTLQNRRVDLFRLFAEACAELPVQLVLTHGGGIEPQDWSDFPGNPIVVSYAPQLEVLSKASLTLTHAGLNTVLDSLSAGVPVVAIPITYEQPAIASRIRHVGVGQVLSFDQLNSANIRIKLSNVLQDPKYRNAALGLKESIQAAGGVNKAANLIESTCGLP